MFENLKKKLYYKKMSLLFEKGLQDGTITPFDEDFYKKMSNTYIGCLPVSMRIRYLNPSEMIEKKLIGKESLGQCYDRSLYMFFCFENAVLVRGNIKDLELKYGNDEAGHGWIEMDGYCYDPSLLLKFKKEVYYEIYMPYNISKLTIDEYKNCGDSNRKLYYDVINTTLDDFKSNGRKREELILIIPPLQKIAGKYNENLVKELNDYLQSIQYDEKQILNEINNSLQKYLEEENSLSLTKIK